MTDNAFQKDKVAIITGAALGIGRAMAKRFTSLGMHVLMLDVDQDALQEAGRLAGSNAVTMHCDVANLEDWQQVKKTVYDQWGQPPSVLVNNAVTRTGRGFDADITEWRRAIDVNLFGIINGVNTFRQDMEKANQSGVIINVGSKQGITNPPGHPVYNLSKAAIKSYSEGLQHDLRQTPETGVNAYLLVPGWTTTGKNEHKQGAWLPEQVVEYMMKAVAKNSFYIICPDDETTEEMDKQRILHAANDIIEDRVPLSRWYPSTES